MSGNLLDENTRGYIVGKSPNNHAHVTGHEASVIFDSYDKGDLDMDHILMLFQLRLPKEDVSEATRVRRFPKGTLHVEGTKR